MIELTMARTKELLAEAVALKGEDYVYTTLGGEKGNALDQPACFYVHDDHPGCLVGHVLHGAGVSLARLRDVEDTIAEGALRILSDTLTAEDGVSQLLTEVQNAQDCGVPWGEAVRRATGPGPQPAQG